MRNVAILPIKNLSNCLVLLRVWLHCSFCPWCCLLYLFADLGRGQILPATSETSLEKFRNLRPQVKHLSPPPPISKCSSIFRNRPKWRKLRNIQKYYKKKMLNQFSKFTKSTPQSLYLSLPEVSVSGASLKLEGGRPILRTGVTKNSCTISIHQKKKPPRTRKYSYIRGFF